MAEMEQVARELETETGFCVSTSVNDVIPTDRNPLVMARCQDFQAEDRLPCVPKAEVTVQGQSLHFANEMNVTHHNEKKEVHKYYAEKTIHCEGNYIQQYNSSDPGSNPVIDLTRIEISIQEDIFVETQFYVQALDILKNTPILLIIGPPRSGKSSLGYAVLRHFSKEMEYTPLILRRFKKWQQHVGGDDRKQIFLFEHIFGKDSVNHEYLQDWSETFDIMQKLARSDKFLAVITVNENIYNETSIKHLYSELLGAGVKILRLGLLTVEEKRSIIRKHLEKHDKNITDDDLKKILGMEVNESRFAFRCKQFAKTWNGRSDSIEVFASPMLEIGIDFIVDRAVDYHPDKDLCQKVSIKRLKIAPNILKAVRQDPLPRIQRSIHNRFIQYLDISSKVLQAVLCDNIEARLQKLSHCLQRKDVGNVSDGNLNEVKPEQTPLHDACRDNKVEILLELLKTGEDPDVQIQDYVTPLHVASFYGHLHAVKALLQSKSAVDKSDNWGWTALHYACVQGHSDVVDSLLHHNATVDAAMSGNITPLFLACCRNQVKVVERLLQVGASLQAKTKDASLTPLHVACGFGYLEIAKKLTEYGQKVDVVDKRGWTPLHFACQEGHMDVVKFLIQHAAKTDKIQFSEDKQMCIDCQYGHYHLVRCLFRCAAFVKDQDDDIYICHNCFHFYKHAIKNVNKHNHFVDPPSAEVTPLFMASQNGHQDIVKYLLKAGACSEVIVDYDDVGRWTPLHAACWNNHKDVIILLLEYKSNLNVNPDMLLSIKQPSSDLWVGAPLILSCIKGDVTLLKLLLKHGANASSLDGCMRTPLHIAARFQNIEAFCCLMEQKDVNIWMQDDFNYTPLSYACSEGHNDIVEIITERETNYESKFYRDALIIACSKGHLDTVKLLLDCNVPVNESEVCESEALYIACRGGFSDVAELLLLHKANTADQNHVHTDGTSDENCGKENCCKGESAIQRMCEKGDAAILKILLKYGAHTKIKAFNDNTLLHTSSGNGHVDVVKLLMEYKSDVNARNFNDNTPLHLAAERGYKHVTDVLLTEADIEATNLDGFTPLNLACQATKYSQEAMDDTEACNADGNANVKPLSLERGCIAVVRQLLKKGANPNVVSCKQDTPLHFASGYLSLVLLLLKHGSDVNVKNEDGNTPLHVAVKRGRADVVRVLLQHAAIPDTRNNTGDSLLHLALTSLKIVEMLLSEGLDTNAQNGDGCTPLHLACKLLQENKVLKNDYTNSLNSTMSQRVGSFTMAPFQTFMPSIAYQPYHYNMKPNDKLSYTYIQPVSKFQLISSLHAFNHHVVFRIKSTLENIDDNLQLIKAVVRTLFDHGASIDIKDQKGFKPLNYAHDDSSLEVMYLEVMDTIKRRDLQKSEHLEKSSSKEDSEISMRKHRDSGAKQLSEETEEMPETRESIDSAAQQFSLPEAPSSEFQSACYKGDTDLVVQIICSGESVNGQSKAGLSPLHYACARGNVDTVDYLLKRGASVHVQDNAGRSPLHYACANGYPIICAMLLGRGAMVRASDKTGSTPLHLACHGGHKDVAVILLIFGADVSSRNLEGETPLTIAKVRGHKELCYFLQRQ